MRVELFKGKGSVQPWYIRLVGANGKTLVTSEGYATKWGAKRAARRTFPGVPIKEMNPHPGPGQFIEDET